MNPIASRTARLARRIRDSHCPRDIARLVATMTDQLHVEAIPALIALLDHEHDSRDSVSDALLRYGESAEDSLRAVVATPPTHGECAAERVLDRMARQARFRQVGCFHSI